MPSLRDRQTAPLTLREELEQRERDLLAPQAAKSADSRGRLRPELDCFDAFRATFPAGTLTGAPKIRAMEIIEELEPVRRGVSGGSLAAGSRARTAPRLSRIRNSG